jgi:hypothetical protein
VRSNFNRNSNLRHGPSARPHEIRLHWFETEVLSQDENLEGLSRINRELIAKAEAMEPPPAGGSGYGQHGRLVGSATVRRGCTLIAAFEVWSIV